MSTPGEFGLPSDLLTAVLEHLPQDELRNASQVSRDFYRAAHAAGLVLHCTMHTFGPMNNLEMFTEIVRHAESRPHLFRLGLSLLASRFDEETQLWDDAWKAVRRAMPFLVSLDMRIEPEVLQLVYAALDVSAPQLGELSIESHDFMSDSIDIPSALFGGDAPRLWSVELSGPALSPTAALVPAFRRVRALRVGSYVAGQAVDVARFFPALNRLDLCVLNLGSKDPRRVELGGLDLDSLTVINDFALPLVYTAPARAVIIKDLSSAPGYDAALWPDTETPLHARIETEMRPGSQRPRPGWIQAPAHCEVLAVGSAVPDGWSYTHYCTPGAVAPRDLPALKALSPLRARLVSLSIEDAMLVRMLRTDSTLAALRELYVACAPARMPERRKTSVRVQAQPAPVSLRCPALERITVFAATAPVSVGCQRIAPLGELRPAERKSVLLVLARVAVNYDNMDGPLLHDVFSKVRVVDDDAATCAPAYYHRREANPRFVQM